MKKKLFVLLSLLFSVVLIGASATACMKESNNSETSSEFASESIPNSTPESSFDSSVDMTTTLILSADSLDLDLYASATLTATLINSEEPIIWSSSDESIVKVVDGVVTAYKTGSATITAKAGEVAKSCVVTVGEKGVFAFSGLQESVDLMKGSSMPLDLTLTYNDVDFTMAEISVQPEGNGLSYVDDMLIAVEYGTQNLVITATVNGTVVHTHTMVVTVFESGSVDVELEGGEIALKIGGEGFAISNFKAMVNGLLLENPEFTFEFETEGFVKVEDGMICPVAEGSTTATVCFTTTQNTYNRIVFIKVYKEAINLGNVLAKGDAGKTVQNIGLAAIDLSEKEIALQDVEKVLINGEETTAYTIEGNVITFINPNGGSNEIVLETAMAKYNLDACFYGHSISTLAELEEWRTGNIAAYTILLNDIDCEGETLAVIESGYKAGQLDGLGHTVCNFVLKKGFIHGIDATGAIRNIQFVNFIQDCSSAGAGAVGFGVLATDNAGTIENVLLKGKLINVPNADHYGLLYKGALEGSVCQNVFAELTSDGVGNHYTGPMWRVDTGNYILSNVAFVFNGNVHNSDYNPTQVMAYVDMEEFVQNMDAALWNGWTIEEGKFFLSNYDNAEYSVYSFGEATLGESISIHSSGFEPIVCEVVEGAEFVTVEGNVLTILLTANAGENISVAVKDENGNVLDTFEYTITLEASLFAKGKALVGETVEFIITSTLPDEMFTVEVLEGEEFGTLNGRMFTIKEDAEVGSIIKIKVSCSADASWGDVFDFVVSREEIIGESLFNPSSGYEGSATDEVAVPEGFENVYKYSGTDEFIHGGHYLAENLDDYSLVTFAIKSPKIRLDSYGWAENNEWLVFTLMQTDTAVWSLEVSENGKIIHTASGLSGNRSDGAYRYNALNSILFGVPSTGYYFNVVEGVMTAYFTEVRGITSAVEVPVEPIEPVGTIIQDCVYDEAGAGFTVSDEIAVAPGFERLYKHASNAEFIHGLNFSGVNLDNYSLVTFAIKTANFNMNSEGANTSNEWLVFTLTQVSPDTWDLVVTQNGETVYTKAGLNGAYATNDAYTDNALDAILYGNPSGFSPTGVDGNLLIYVTELRGVEKSIEPVGTIIQDCVFDITDFNTGTSFVASTEIAMANGFEKLYKYENAGQDALHGGNWSGVNLDNYSLVTFAIKTAKFNFNNESTDLSNEWLVFTLTQTGTAVWDLVVTKNGEVVYEKAGLSGNRETGGAYVYNALDAILYGVPSAGYTAWGVDGNLLIYVTELRGVSTVVEPDPEEPVGTIIDNCVYVSYGFQETNEISVPAGFEKVSKYQGEDAFIHGAHFSDVNLDNYSVVTFALKTASFNMNSTGANESNEWLVFTLTQTAPDTWDLVVTQNGEIVHENSGLRGAYDSSANPNYHDNALDAILYGNPSGYSPTGVDGSMLIYATEFRGISTVVEPETPINKGLIADKLYESGYNFVETDEISAVEGFESVYKYSGVDEALHGAYMTSVNLDEYLRVRFAVKATKYNFNNVSTDTSNEWLVFTLTQTDTAVWSLVVTKNGEIVHVANGLSGNRDDGSYSYNALDAILYGVPSTGYAPWALEGSIVVYTTEVLGDLPTGEVSISDTDKTFLVKSEGGNGATVSLSELGLGIPTVTSVLIDGEEFADFSVSNDAVIFTDAPRGDHEYTFIYGEDGYRVDGCVYDNGLSTAEDVNSWRNGLAGYSVLLNNVDYEGTTIGAGGFVTDQTLDGRGYKISNFIMTANFVTRLYNNNAVVKNVYFDDVTQDCSAWSGAVDQGIFGNWHSGKIENVYVNIKTINMSGEHYGVLFYGTEPNAVVRNVVVEIESATENFHYVHMENNGAGAVVEGVVGSYVSGATEGGNAAWGAASGFHQYLNWMIIEEANDELLSFTSPYWVIDTAANTITMLPLEESKIETVEDGYLVKDGVSAYTIVTADNLTAQERTAVTELRTLFKEATGVELRAIVASAAEYDDNAKYISIGNTDLVVQAGISINMEELGSQGYALCTKGQSIFIIGQPQGTIYGVYEFLHRTLNFEQYTKTVYTLDHVSDLALLDVDIVDVPDVEHRVAFSGVQLNDETSRQRMRTQNASEIIMNKGGAHNMIRYIVPFDTYYSTNPTWFSSKTDSNDTYETTQLCYTAGSYGSSSYNAMKAVAVANIKQIILDNPNADMMSLTQMDVENMWCNCSGCQAVISQYGEESATQILFINDVVSEIETWLNNEQGGRKVKFMMFAYYETQEAPTKGSLKLHEDVSVWIAPIKDNFMTGVNASGNSLGTMLTDWKDNASSVAIWAYGVYFSEYLVPYNTFDYIDQMIDACVASNAEYMWVQGNWNTTQNTGFDSLKAYLISKLMWDSTLDVDTLTDNYFNAVYGAAAATMKTVYTEMKAELASMSLSGNIYDAPCGFNDWDNNYLTTQLGRLETAISEIASLQSSDPAKYQLIYDAIVCESISFRYIYKENSLFGWGGNYDTDAWGTFEEDVTRLGFTMIREGETMDSYLS